MNKWRIDLYWSVLAFQWKIRSTEDKLIHFTIFSRNFRSNGLIFVAYSSSAHYWIVNLHFCPIVSTWCSLLVKYNIVHWTSSEQSSFFTLFSLFFYNLCRKLFYFRIPMALSKGYTDDNLWKKLFEKLKTV